MPCLRIFNGSEILEQIRSRELINKILSRHTSNENFRQLNFRVECVLKELLRGVILQQDEEHIGELADFCCKNGLLGAAGDFYLLYSPSIVAIKDSIIVNKKRKMNGIFSVYVFLFFRMLCF